MLVKKYTNWKTDKRTETVNYKGTALIMANKDVYTKLTTCQLFDHMIKSLTDWNWCAYNKNNEQNNYAEQKTRDLYKPITTKVVKHIGFIGRHTFSKVTYIS